MRALIVILILSLAISPKLAVAQETSALSLSFLEKFWNKEGANREESEKSFTVNFGLQSNDANFLSAYSLNRLNHNRYREALPVLKRLVELAPKDMDGWMELSWVETVLDSPNDALISLQKLKVAMAETPGNDPRRERSLIHLGRLVGFLEGPFQSKINQEIFRITVAKIGEGLTPAELGIYNDAAQETIKKFDDFIANQKTAKTEFLVDAKIKADSEIALMENQNQMINQRRDQISPEIEKLNEQYNVQAETLRAQALPLQSQYGGIQGQISGLQFELQQNYSQIVYLQSLLSNTRNVQDRYIINSQISQLYFWVRGVESQIIGAQNQLRAINSQLHAITSQLNQLSFQHADQVSRLNQEQKELDRQLARNFSKARKLNEGPKRVTGEALGISNRIDILTSYYELPIEQFRNELLDRIKNKN